MGPASTIRFLDLVMGKYRDELGARNNRDFPQVTILTIPNSDHLGPIPDKTIRRELAQAVRVLESMGVAFIVAPCNTVHRFFPVRGQSVEVLDIARALVRECTKELSSGRILFLSTRQTRESSTYRFMFREARRRLVFLADDDQLLLDDIIALANPGGDLAEERKALEGIVRRYRAEAIVLACTELSLLRPLKVSCRVADSLEALALATFRVSSQRYLLAYYRRRKGDDSLL